MYAGHDANIDDTDVETSDKTQPGKRMELLSRKKIMMVMMVVMTMTKP